MGGKNEQGGIGEVKSELLESYKKHLDKIFASETFDLTFDEREKLIVGSLKEEAIGIIEKHIEKDPDSSTQKKDNPEQTCLCCCGLEAILYRDAEGFPKVFEREIQTKNGLVKVKEYGYYCSKDRKFFFPSPKKT